MCLLKDFFNYIKQLESRHRIDDVLVLLKQFENLEIDNWFDIMDTHDGEPCSTPLYQSEQLKLSIIYWKGKQSSTVHSHPGGGGLIKMLSGSLMETRFSPDDEEVIIDHHEIEPGNIEFIHDMFAWHQICNPNETPAVSLHLYSLVNNEEYM